jgi:hypothetical protein
MGTKNNPGKFDCYANAKPDEPMFILLGRDRHAAGLVRLWALIRYDAGEEPGKVAEALGLADHIDAWQRRLGKDPARQEGAFSLLFEMATAAMDEHPDGWQHACACHKCTTLKKD